jgi:uncharacterized repeat protein (TIGR01451 family)
MFKFQIVTTIGLGTIASILLAAPSPASPRHRNRQAACIDSQPANKRVGLILKADKKVVEGNKTIFKPLVGKVSAKPGDVIRYTAVATNNSRCPLRNLMLKQSIPRGAAYLQDSAQPSNGVELSFSVDGGKTFSTLPKIGTQTVPATEYNYLRWKFTNKIPTNAKVITSYKLLVK